MLRRAVPDLVTGDTPWLGMRHCAAAAAEAGAGMV